MSKVKVKDIENILRPGVPDQLSKLQAHNLVLQLIILCTDTIDNDALKFLTRFFTPQDYDDLVEERTVLSRCGYPSCPYMLRDSRGNVRNPLVHTVLPWQHEYCQLACYQAGEFYREQLSREPLETRKNVAWFKYGDMSYEQNVLLLPEVRALAHMNHKTVAETVAEIIRSQHLELKVAELEIDKPPEQDTAKSVTALGIKEHGV